ncbi:hypothetical protein V6N11_048251 [Hibiscus sabdariffa]|uniref:Uncharacterized protein n=1 Tax=Hibiscus sabdariffa TaxID=183260 RepID=A0ABR2PUN4_9ROSI
MQDKQRNCFDGDCFNVCRASYGVDATGKCAGPPGADAECQLYSPRRPQRRESRVVLLPLFCSVWFWGSWSFFVLCVHITLSGQQVMNLF